MLFQRSSRMALLALGLMAAALPAQTPLGTTFTYQGRLKNAGNPANGLHDLRFRLFDALAGGGQVASTVCRNNVNVTDGLFTVALDFGAQFAGQERFLEIEVRADTGLDCTNAAGFIVLAPRQALTAAPNALSALDADRLDGLDSTAFLQSIPVPLNLSGTNGGGVIKGSNSGTVAAVMGVQGEATSTAATGNSYGGFFTAVDAVGIGALGRASGVSGVGVRGVANAATGTNWGVYGSAASPSGVGVLGENADNVGVRGNATGTTGANFGVYGLSNSAAGRGVTGVASAGTGTNYGVVGQSDSVTGTGVFGVSTSTVAGQGTGVHGVSHSDGSFPEDAGVLGESFGNNAEGVVGMANIGAAALGVWGISTSGYAGYFTGDVAVIGTLSKAGGSFKIDHPLDPANKYLAHSFVESPDMMNIYNGNVVTGPDGFAWVDLPDYFETLNRDFRYQLTVVGQFAQAIVAEKVRDNRFAIRTDKPAVEVSWQVTGVRQDPWAEAHRIQVEPEKSPAARGKYLNPELYGQPDELGESRSMAAVRAAAAKAERRNHEHPGPAPGVKAHGDE